MLRGWHLISLRYLDTRERFALLKFLDDIVIPSWFRSTIRRLRMLRVVVLPLYKTLVMLLVSFELSSWSEKWSMAPMNTLTKDEDGVIRQDARTMALPMTHGHTHSPRKWTFTRSFGKFWRITHNNSPYTFKAMKARVL